MVVVPRTALLQTGERAVVFVRGADGALEPREVLVGMVAANEVEIVSGVQAGEVVVSSASFLIDAESNLGASADAMPGMDMSAPATSSPSAAPDPALGRQ
jgi:membrane fusion protein, copper/silver efflux system